MQLSSMRRWFALFLNCEYFGDSFFTAGGDAMICLSSRIDGGELFDRVLDDNYILTEKACSIFVRQICEALDFIHDKNVIHLDLKPENILCITQTGLFTIQIAF